MAFSKSQRTADRMQKVIVKRWPGKKLGTTSKNGGKGIKVEQLNFEKWIVKERNWLI